MSEQLVGIQMLKVGYLTLKIAGAYINLPI